MGADRPYVPAEQLEECDRGARRVAEQNRPTVQLPHWPSREQRHALHRPVARDPDLGEEPEQIGVARVLDRADHAHIELSRHQQLVQLGRGPAGRALARPGTQSSNVRTVWYSESRSTGSFPAPRTSSMIWSYESHIGVAAPASW